MLHRSKLATIFLVMVVVVLGADNAVWAKGKKHRLHRHKVVVETYADRPEVDEFAKELAKQGMDETFVIDTLHKARKLESVRNAMKPASVRARKNWQVYRSQFLDEEHIEDGVAFLDKYKNALERASRQYGVPERIIVGILGVETAYGTRMGNYRLIDSLTTLAFDYPPGGRDRSTYFRGQLASFLEWCARANCDPFSEYGSYAGAVGMPQFMPENIDKFGVDFDADGQIDLQTAEDAIGSVARFLAKHGWTPGLKSYYDANLNNPDLDILLEPDIVPSFSGVQLLQYGVVPKAILPPWEKFSLIELRNDGSPNDYFIGTHNFFVLTRYNRSAYYAKAVLDLGTAVEAAYARQQVDKDDGKTRKSESHS
jgi:membrane-bound lytic murein transglycosylase B